MQGYVCWPWELGGKWGSAWTIFRLFLACTGCFCCLGPSSSCIYLGRNQASKSDFACLFMGILHAFWSTCWLTMFSSDLPDRRHCTMDGKPRKRGVFHAWHSRRLNAHSPSVSRLALPPAAVVLMEIGGASCRERVCRSV